MQFRQTLAAIAAAFVLVVCFAIGTGSHVPAAQKSFDRLSEKDRAAFAKRFAKEIWPLMKRNGKDGCVGCHRPDHSSSLRLTGEPDADFRMMLREGFFLINDLGGMLHHVSTRDKRLRMPPGDRPPWSSDEIERLRTFLTDLDRRQNK